MGWKGRERQREYGPSTSVFMDINNLEKEVYLTNSVWESQWSRLFELENVGVTHIRRKL